MAVLTKRQFIREIIGRNVTAVTSSFWWRFGASKTVDRTKTDYGFWDKFRRVKLPGYEMAGIFAKPITEILAAHVMGRQFALEMVTADDSEAGQYTAKLLKGFVNRYHSRLLNLVVDLYGLGDQYVVVNQVDGSLSIVSPETVSMEYDPLDYRTPVRATILTALDTATVTDVYTADERVITVKNTRSEPLTLGDGTVLAKGQQAETVYPNLIGRLPVIHFANDRGTNETSGRPIFEGLLRTFARYDDLIEKMLDGAELMGNPIPVFEGMEDVDGTIDAHTVQDDEQYQDNAGNLVDRVKVAVDRLTAIFIGKGGSFKFASPQSGFTDDIRNALKLLFLLVLDYTRIPEAIWGNELSSARASAEEQLKVFGMYIEGRRTALEGQGTDELLGAAQGGLLELVDIWLRVQQIIQGPKVLVGAVRIVWPDLSDADAEMTLKWAEFLQRIGAIDRMKAVEISELVEDAQAAVEAADAEAAARVDPYEAAVNEELAA